MTVIAWDGTKLAADRQYTCGGMRRAVTKIHKVPGGMVGLAGSALHVMAVLAWFNAGRPHGKYPRVEDPCDAMFVDTGGQVWHFNGDDGMPTEGRYDAIGCGRDYALAVMWKGGDAVEGVRCAGEHDCHCGMGYDVITLEEIQPPPAPTFVMDTTACISASAGITQATLQ